MYLLCYIQYIIFNEMLIITISYVHTNPLLKSTDSPLVLTH